MSAIKLLYASSVGSAGGGGGYDSALHRSVDRHAASAHMLSSKLRAAAILLGEVRCVVGRGRLSRATNAGRWCTHS